VVRDTQGEVHRLLILPPSGEPACCRADAGNAATFTCAYHGWTYGNDGNWWGCRTSGGTRG